MTSPNLNAQELARLHVATETVRAVPGALQLARTHGLDGNAALELAKRAIREFDLKDPEPSPLSQGVGNSNGVGS